MSKLIVISIILLQFSFLLIPVNVDALSPGPEVYECLEEKNTGSVSNNCSRILCEWNNTEKNWPKNTGYYEDCNQYENKLVIYIIASFLAIIGVVGTVFIIKNLSKSKK